jgi:hypothetical protein
LLFDGYKHAFDILPQFRILKPQRSDPELLQERASSRIGILRRFMIVRRPTELDGELLRRTVEIEDVRPNAVLPPEFASQQLPALEKIPEVTLFGSQTGT